MWLRRPKRTLSEFGFTNFSGYADDPAVQAQQAQNQRAYRTYVDTKKADARRQFTQAGLTALGVVGGPAAVGAFSGGAAGGSATGAAYPGAGLFGAPATAGTTGASGMTLGNFLNFANLGTGLFSNVMGQRANNRAISGQQSLAEREMQMRMAADAEARAEQRRQFDATQANEARRMAAEDEERKFMRSRQEYDMQLIREREARNQQRRQRLAQFLGLR